MRTGPLSFDPVLVGNRETDAWAAYYRHEWRAFLTALRAYGAARGLRPHMTMIGLAERFQEVALSFAEYAHLDALQAVVWLARSGDLEMELLPGQLQPLSELDVLASYQRHGRYRTAAVLRELLGAVPATPPSG